MNLFEVDLITEVLLDRHRQDLGDLQLTIVIPNHPNRLLLRLLIETDCGRHRWIFEAGVSRPPHSRDLPKGQSLVLDFMDQYVAEWLAADRGVRPPINYTAYRFRGLEVFLRGRRRDLQAERMAAELLGEPMEPDLEDVD